MKITHSFTYIFLIWNLFLAVIPYAITMTLKSKRHLNSYALSFWCCVWLLFLPNAPYIITDLLHLSNINNSMLWLDVLLLTSFAYNGLIVFFLSVFDMQILIASRLSKNKTRYFINIVFMLTGFGVYLGRFLRYNSWDILQQPLALLEDISIMILQPRAHIEIWLFTFCFGSFLMLSFWLFKAFKRIE
ncbi:DUF1361 domain-containing protein [Lacinutrix iliipiscaria]|uniref:DUF1361 domain-containing protein n=1 Tax=Lacinutrix iliipiscaria TaxID=1230532 RepID=A0ABW5WQ69_9FLAO